MLAPRQRRRPRRALGALLALAVLAGGLAVLWGAVGLVEQRVVLRERCEVRAAGEDYRFSVEQAANAATIAGVGLREGVGERGVTIALATAMQESKLRNLDYGDRDSLGLFQQRPSQGWGTAAQIRDPVYASTEFYRALKKVPSYTRLPLTDAAQAVQKSGHPGAYEQHGKPAAALTAALTGRSPGALGCGVRPPDARSQAPNANGLVPRAQTVLDDLEEVFGDQQVGGFAPQGVSGGHVDGSAHYEGRAVDVFYRPVGEAQRRRSGWATASWAVAHADRLGIATVIYDGRIWSARRSAEGWRDYVHPNGPTNDPVLMHRDHVHIDVLG